MSNYRNLQHSRWDCDTANFGGIAIITVGRDEEVIRDYIRHQEEEDQRQDKLLFDNR